MVGFRMSCAILISLSLSILNVVYTSILTMVDGYCSNSCRSASEHKNRDVTCNVNPNFSIEQHICSCNSSIRCVLLTSY